MKSNLVLECKTPKYILGEVTILPEKNWVFKKGLPIKNDKKNIGFVSAVRKVGELIYLDVKVESKFRDLLLNGSSTVTYSLK